MKITYIGGRNRNILIRKKMYVFNANNNYTVDVVDYSHIYAMFQDKRHGKFLMFTDDPKLKSIKLKSQKPFVGVLGSRQNKNAVVSVKTKTALGKSKTQTVESLDTAIEESIGDVKDIDIDKIDAELQETAKKIEAVKGKTNGTKKSKTVSKK